MALYPLQSESDWSAASPRNDAMGHERRLVHAARTSGLPPAAEGKASIEAGRFGPCVDGSGQGFSSRLRRWSEQPCVRPVSAVPCTVLRKQFKQAGHRQSKLFVPAARWQLLQARLLPANRLAVSATSGPICAYVAVMRSRPSAPEHRRHRSATHRPAASTAHGRTPVTNIRNTSSPHWRGWLKPENRCLVPFNNFAEYAPEPNPETKKKDAVWFALKNDRPLTAFAGIWTEFKGDRWTKS